MQPNAVNGGRPGASPAHISSSPQGAVERISGRPAVGSGTENLQFQEYTKQEQAQQRRKRLPEPQGAFVSRTPETFSALIDAQEDHSTGQHSAQRTETAPFGSYLRRGVGSYDTTQQVVTGTLTDRGNTLSLVY
ncbi:hypothetical protein [Magnetospira sp. QH-2]|uniref:hypothetical protein n=1 Tax=Magnetospira sp. (strain QH-2) TaxID=1288970 RepID=UPI0011DDB471|nr:hypothetical protein [Magnetospira sp. QH-2]